MFDDDIRARIEKFERDCEKLAGTIESCRKAVMVSKALMALGAVVLGAGLFGIFYLTAPIAVLSFAAAIGGFVWCNASYSSWEEASRELKAVESERTRAIDALDLRGGATLH